MTSPLLLLAEKVEGLEQGSREIDWLIAEALGEIPAHGMRTVGFDYDWYRKPDEYALWRATDSEGRSVKLWQPESRTASLDAAMSLVPEGCVLHALGQSQSPSDEKRPWLAMVVQRGQSLSTGRTSYSATPALAICAAALRARAAMEAGE